MYLKLGFRHIVPEGTDHILFVLGLFFLGITWRKLLAQTTVFTVAHATTLFLSTLSRQSRSRSPSSRWKTYLAPASGPAGWPSCSASGSSTGWGSRAA